MRLKKDLFSDILYGSMIGFVILMKESMVQEINLVSLLLSNYILAGLFYLWLFTISSKFTKSIFLNSNAKLSNSEIAVSAIKIILDMIQIKVVILILIFLIFSLFSNNFHFELHLSSIFQLLTSAVYVISIYTLMQFFGSKSYLNWSFTVALFLPFLIFILFYSIFNIKNSEYITLIPLNFYMIFDINNKVIIALSSVIFGFTFFLFSFCLKLIKEGKKIYHLPSERVN